MKAIVGLGNPGDGYRDTYHNMGFMALDSLCERLNARAFSEEKFALVTDVYMGEKVFLIKPLTYMNLSGDAVAYYARYYKIDSRDILVIYDDIDIKKGIVRARDGGSAGTHNGMRDLVAKLGTSEFPRVRIGTGFKPNYMNLADYVLSHVPAAERPTIDRAVSAACDYAEDFIAGKAWNTLTKDVTNIQ